MTIWQWFRSSPIAGQKTRSWLRVLGTSGTRLHLYDIDLTYVHIMGKQNMVADLLSRWQNSIENVRMLHENVQDPLWIQIPNDLLMTANDI